MSWFRKLFWKEKEFGMIDGSLLLSKEQVKELGDDLPSVIDWFMSDDAEDYSLVQKWRDCGYDKQFFEPQEIEKIYNSRFADDDDKYYCFHDVRAERRAAEKQNPKPKKQHPGYVYLIRAENGYYKIGRAKNYQERIERLEVKLPFSIEPLHILQCVDMVESERALHIKFQDKRVNGEWFALTPEDVEYIKNMSA